VSREKLVHFGEKGLFVFRLLQRELEVEWIAMSVKAISINQPEIE
jgi:hypothetical protein